MNLDPIILHLFTLRDIKTGRILCCFRKQNTVVTICKNMIAKRLAGVANDCNITYGAVGTGVYPEDPAGAITLSTELSRVMIANASATASVAYITSFFGTGAGNGTLTNFGLFGEAATGAADSGTLINITKIDIVKTNLQTLTVDSQFVIN